LALFYFA
jgi:MFS family permease